jgi:hypothetical protein
VVISKKWVLLTGLSLGACASFDGARNPAQQDPVNTLPTTMEQFLDWEANHNLGKTRYPIHVMDLPHVDIPLDAPQLYQINSHYDWMYGVGGKKGVDAVIFDEAHNLDPKIRSYFLIKKNGKNYYRYYTSPFDNYFLDELKTYLAKLNVPFEEGAELKAYPTSSRSVIAFDAKTGKSFSLKTSTRSTSQGANDFEVRPLPTRFSEAVRRLSDYFDQMLPQLKHLDVALEPFSMGIPALDQSLSVRLMEGVSEGKVQQMSGFVFVDTAEARAVANRAGKTFDEFWDEAFHIKGKAMAELALVLGFQTTSNHAQNFRWELDTNGKLTGRAVYLDLSDGRPNQAIFEANGQQELLMKWEKVVGDTNPVNKGHIGIPYFFRGDHGTEAVPEKYFRQTFAGVLERLSELTGASQKNLEKAIRPIHAYERRHGWYLDPEHRAIKTHMQSYFASLKAARARLTPCAQSLKSIVQ